MAVLDKSKLKSAWVEHKKRQREALEKVAGQNGITLSEGELLVLPRPTQKQIRGKRKDVSKPSEQFPRQLRLMRQARRARVRRKLLDSLLSFLRICLRLPKQTIRHLLRARPSYPYNTLRRDRRIFKPAVGHRDTASIQRGDC